MMISKPKIKNLKIFACPEGCKRRYYSLTGLNVHLTKTHSSKYKVMLDIKIRAYSRMTLPVKRA